MSKTWKIILFGALPLIVILVVLKKTGAIGASEEGHAVEFNEVTERTIVETVLASGKIQPRLQVKLAPEVSGEIKTLTVEEGDRVSKGDLLVRINPDIYESAVNRNLASVNSARASLAQSRAQLVETEKRYERSQGLLGKGAVSQAEFDAVKREYDVAVLGVEAAKFQLQSAEANLTEARNNLARTTIYSPIDGTVSKLAVEEGERVVGTAQMAGTELMRIADLGSMEVVVEVNENDIIRVNEGDTADIEVEAFPDEMFEGVVTEMSSSALSEGTSADQITNFEVTISILPDSYAHLMEEGDEKAPFRPGMTASVSIRTETRENVPTVPVQAVTVRDDTASTGVLDKYRKKDEDKGKRKEFEVLFLHEDGKARLQVVKTGIQDEEYIEILEGVEAGSEVISGPYNVVFSKLNNGDAVYPSESSKGKPK